MRGVSLGDLLQAADEEEKNFNEMAKPLNLLSFLERDVNYGFGWGG